MLGWAQLKKSPPSGARRDNFWGISCGKSRFYAKKNHIFSNFRGAHTPPPSGSTPVYDGEKKIIFNERMTCLVGFL